MKNLRFFSIIAVSAVVATAATLKIELARADLYGSSARVFPISTANDSGEKIACSASLMALHDAEIYRCILITNDHCLFEDSKSVELQIPADVSNEIPRGHRWKTWFPDLTSILRSEPTKSKLQLRVLKRDRSEDLVELEIPQTLEKNFCSSLILNPVKNTPPEKLAEENLSTSSTALGYIQGRPTLEFTGRMAPKCGTAYHRISLYLMGENGHQLLLKLPKLSIYPGMSGGVVNTIGQNVIGITKGYELPLSDTSYVIPIQTVYRFAKDPVPSKTIADYEHLPAAVAAHFQLKPNSVHFAGSNTHGGGGNNTHGTGGGNTHAGGATRDSRYTGMQNLHVFRTPNEGMPYKQGCERRLFAAGDNQIDGIDDYRIHYASKISSGNSPGKLILSECDGYPDTSARKSIMSRLKGHYLWKPGSAVLDGTRNVMYIEDAAHPFGWRPIAQGDGFAELRVTPNQIILGIGEHHMNRPENPFRWERAPASTIIFDIASSPDAKNITLTIQKEYAPPGIRSLKLECNNFNYLKLICANPDMEFSLSLKSTEPGKREMTYSITRKFLFDDGSNGINHYLGKVHTHERPRQ